METVFEKWKREILQTALAQGFEEGQKQGWQNMAVLLLQRKLGALNPNVEAQIRGLSTDLLQELSLALLDFSKPQDLTAWLKRHAPVTPQRRAKN